MTDLEFMDLYNRVDVATDPKAGSDKVDAVVASISGLTVEEVSERIDRVLRPEYAQAA